MVSVKLKFSPPGIPGTVPGYDICATYKINDIYEGDVSANSAPLDLPPKPSKLGPESR